MTRSIDSDVSGIAQVRYHFNSRTEGCDPDFGGISKAIR
jgi:hypothetical protein